MKKFKTLFIAILALVVLALCVACGDGDKPKTDSKEFVDYASTVKLDFSNNTKKQEVTVRLYVDGDTTHFNPKTNSTLTPYNAADFADTEGYIKARYIAINTPESTGKIEEWGGKASLFTRGKLESATSIVVESDDDKWNIDSSGSKRHVVWVWYKPEGETEYHNLNLEILQAGLALGSSAANNRYGQVATKALNQARNLQLYVFSDERDPDFHYGAAIPVTIKELRCNIGDYYDAEKKAGKKVKVEGVVTSEFDNSVYIEDFDPDTGLYFGFSVYYGYQVGAILEVFTMGNRVSVVGNVSEFNGTYQISGVSYSEFDPTLPANSTVISEGNESAFAETTANDIVNGKVKVEFEKIVEKEDGTKETQTVEKEMDYGNAIMSTTVMVKDLTVVDTYTTNNGGNNDGAISLTCTSGGATIVVRTTVLKDENGNTIKEEAYRGKKINVKGVIDYYEYVDNRTGQTVGQYQVKVYRADYIEILN